MLVVYTAIAELFPLRLYAAMAGPGLCPRLLHLARSRCCCRVRDVPDAALRRNLAAILIGLVTLLSGLVFQVGVKAAFK